MQKDNSYSLKEISTTRTDLSILNVCCKNTRAATFVKEKILKIKSDIETHTLIAGHLNNQLSTIDRLSKQKLSREIMKLQKGMHYVELTYL